MVSTTSTAVASNEIRSTGEITAYYSSDIRLKENVEILSSALEKVQEIRGVEFDWTDEHLATRGGEDKYFVRKHDVGVIAQEVESVLPEIVVDRDDGFKAVRYEKMIPLLIEAIKDLNKKVSQIEETLRKFDANS
jgi:hypothetical protein